MEVTGTSGGHFGCNVEGEQEGAEVEAERLCEAAGTGELWYRKGDSPSHFWTDSFLDGGTAA